MSVTGEETSTLEVADGAAVLCCNGSSPSKVGGGLKLADCDKPSPGVVAKGSVVVICGGASPLGVAKESIVVDCDQKHQQEKSMLLQLEAARRKGKLQKNFEPLLSGVGKVGVWGISCGVTSAA
jgi:hypothetical protein